MNLSRLVLLAALTVAPLRAAAQSTCSRADADGLMRRRQYTEALTCLDSVVAREGPSASLDWGRAVAALLAGDATRAERHAVACLAAPGDDAARTTGCAQVLDRARALVPVPSAEPRPTAQDATQSRAIPTPAPRPPTRPATPPSARLELLPTPPRMSRREPSHVGPVVLWTTAAVSLAVAGSLAIARSAALEPCMVQGDRAVCPDAASLETARQAPSLALGANVLLAVGLVSAAAGAAWWIISSVTVSADPSTGSASLSMGGRW